MNNIILCPGDCESCKFECPMRGELKYLSLESGPVGYHQNQTLNNMNPEWLIWRLDLSVHNLIQTIKIISEEEKPKVNTVIKMIENQIPQQFVEIINKDYNLALKAKFQNLLTVVAQRILIATLKNCDLNLCSECFLKKECPQLKSEP